MPHRVCANCSAEFACPASFRGKNPKCSGCRATHPQRQQALAHGGGAPQNGAAGSAPRHMTPCACHCAACRAAGQGNKCVMVSTTLDQLFVRYGPKDYDYADLKKHVLQHFYHGASRWGTARFDAAIWCVKYGPTGDVIAAGAADGGIHLICAQTGVKILCFKGHR